IARPASVEFLAAPPATEGPLSKRVEVAVDHRLDVDARLPVVDDDARHPATRVGNAGPRHAAVRSRVGPRAELVQGRAAGEECAPPFFRAEAREAAPVAWTEAAARRGEIQRVDAGDGYAGLPGHRRKTRLALVPPKPRLLLITAASVALRV